MDESTSTGDETSATHRLIRISSSSSQRTGGTEAGPDLSGLIHLGEYRKPKRAVKVLIPLFGLVVIGAGTAYGLRSQFGNAASTATVATTAAPTIQTVLIASSTVATTVAPGAVFDPAAGRWGTWPTSSKPNIAIGAKGEAVRYLQGVLAQRGGQTLEIDGDYGAATGRAVASLQGFFKLPVTSAVDAATWAIVDTMATTKK